MQELIARYIEAYNSKDVAGMVSVLSDDVTFENISSSSDTLTLIGKQDFEAQARQVLPLFSEREQRVDSLTVENDRAVAEISYRATVAHDLPNGWKAGQQITLRGVSVFERKDGKLYRISDYS